MRSPSASLKIIDINKLLMRLSQAQYPTLDMLKQISIELIMIIP